jgi:hypothetical protein
MSWVFGTCGMLLAEKALQGRQWVRARVWMVNEV